MAKIKSIFKKKYPNKKKTGTIFCENKNCDKKIINNGKKRFCSNKCKFESRRLFEVTKAELEKMVWEIPTVHIAKKFNVSDKAINKRCKLLGIKKPTRGYWTKIKL